MMLDRLWEKVVRHNPEPVPCVIENRCHQKYFHRPKPDGFVDGHGMVVWDGSQHQKECVQNVGDEKYKYADPRQSVKNV